VETDNWYFVEISWSRDNGLEIYVDQTQVAGRLHSVDVPADHLPTNSRLCVACLNAPKNDTIRLERVAANVAIDELLICYGSLSKLAEFEFLQRGTYVLLHTAS